MWQRKGGFGKKPMKRETASDSMDGRENGHGAFGEEIISDLRRIPGVGEKMEHHLQNIGIRCVEDLVGKDPEELYHLDCLKKGFQDDRCVLYVYRCDVYFAEHEQHDPEKLKWWYWKDKEYPQKEGQEE